MARVLPNALQAVELSQTHFGLPDKLVAGLSGLQIRAVEACRSKMGWEIGSHVDPGDSVLRKSVVEEEGRIGIVTAVPAEQFVTPEAKAVAEDRRSDDELKITLETLKRQVLRDAVALLGAGKFRKIEWQLLDRIEDALRAIDRIGALPTALLQAAPEPPDPKEIARILKKLDIRINDLAKRRFAEMVAEKLRSKRSRKGRKRVDVRRKGKARAAEQTGGVAGDGRAGRGEDETGR